MLDLFCGRLGWTQAFLARGWEVVGVDLVAPPEIPLGLGGNDFKFIRADVLEIKQIGSFGRLNDGQQNAIIRFAEAYAAALISNANLTKTLKWILRHPLNAMVWYLTGKPYSSVFNK